MPIPLAAAAAIASGATQIGQQAINGVLQGAQNRKNRKFAEKMANQQRQWALDDFKMQNEYNSPASQMERYKAAKLNPNLIYGQANTAAPVRSSEQAQWQGRAPQVDLNPGSTIDTYFDTQVKQIQTDNLLKQGQLLDAQVADTDASRRLKETNIPLNEFSLSQRSELRPYQLQKAEMDVKQSQANVNYTLDQNARAAIASESSLAESVARILTMASQRTKVPYEIAALRQQIASSRTSQALQEEDIKLKRMGLSPHDPLYQKKIVEALEAIGDSPEMGFLKKLWNLKVKL